MTRFLRYVIPCLVAVLLAPAFAADLPPKLLSSFEPGGPDFVKGQGTVVAEHATDGAHAYKVTSQPGEYVGISITDGAPLRAFKDYILFKVDVFNPQDQVVHLSARLDDASSKDYGSRYNDDTLVAPPGLSTITINLTGLTRSNARNFAERKKLDIATLRQCSVSFLSAQATTLYFDNVRLEGSGLPTVEGLHAFDFGPVNSAIYPGFAGCDAATTYNDQRGFGWINPTSSDNVYMPDDLTGDYACGQEFRANLPNGKYEVQLCIDHFGLWATYPNFKQRTLTINGQQVLNEKWNGEKFMAQRYYAHEDDEDLPGQDMWDKYIAPRNIIRHYSVEVTDGALHVNLASDNRFGAGISFLVVFPESKKAEGDKWMETLQAKRKAEFNKTLIVRTPTLPAEETYLRERAPGLHAYIRGSDRDLPINAQPASYDKHEATFFATPGERVHAILGLDTDKSLPVLVKASPLTSDDGKTLPASAIQLRMIRNFLKRSGSSRLGTIEPRILTELKTLNLKPDFARGVWITAQVPENAAAGTYKGTINISEAATNSGRVLKSIPLTLTVLPFKLDKITDMTLSVTGATAGPWRGWYPDLEEAWWQNAERAMKDMADHGMNAVTGGPGAKLIAIKDGKAQIDYADMDRWLALAAKYALTMPGDAYQGLTIEGLPWNQGPDMLALMEADSQKRFGLPYKDLIRIVFADVATHAKEKGWSQRIYSTIDEPIPEHGNIEPVAQWIKLATQTSPETLFGGYYSSGAGRDVYFDTLPVTITHLDKTALELTKKSGKQLWDYDGNAARYNIGRWAFVAHKAGLKGYLRNGYMYVCSDPYFDFSDDEGSWCVVYPSKNGINDTVGWERTSDGVNDYRYLATLSRLIQDARKQNKAKPEADAAEAYLQETLKPIDLFDRKTADLTPEGFDQFRQSLSRHITALTQALAP